MNISYLLGRSSQTQLSGETLRDGLYNTDVADFSEEATAHCLKHYRDIPLPGMIGKVTPLKDLTHPSKLNKRTRSSKVDGEGAEQEEEPSRQRRRFDDAPEIKGYLAALKRKQMLLRQDSNPQEVPGSPLLPLRSSSSTDFRDSEVSGEDISLHDNTLTLEPQVPAKEFVSTLLREDNTKRGHSDGAFSSPIRQPFSIVSELDPSLQHLLDGTVSPAVASTTPSPGPTANKSLVSSPPILIQRRLHASEEVTDSIGGCVGGHEESPGAASVSVVGAEDHDQLVEGLSEMPILHGFNSQSHIHTSPPLPYILPNDSPPPSLSLLLSHTFSGHSQPVYPSQGTTSNLRSNTGDARERFNAATFSIRQYYPREE